MPSGFIQLLTTGNESEYLHYNPHITFFKCYYRRHTNFFINNLEIHSNYITGKNNIINFAIPKGGDLLSKSYIKFKYGKNYEEVLKYYINVTNTLLTDITSFYDAYYIFNNNFNKTQIQNINLIKLNCFQLNPINNLQTKYLIIMSTYFVDKSNLISNIKFNENISLEQDELNIFYNINLNYSFYGFNYIISNDKIFSNTNSIINILLNSINYNTLRYIRIDILGLCLKFIFADINNYIYLLNIIFSNIDVNYSKVNLLKINKYDIYVSLYFTNIQKQNNVINGIKQLFINYSTNIIITYIVNKITMSTLTIVNKEINYFINKIFNRTILTKKKYYYNFYLPNITTNANIELTTYNLLESIYFGNFDINDYNQSLINNETKLINMANLNTSTSISMNTNIKLFVQLICKNNTSIRKYIDIINKNNIGSDYLVNLYKNDIINFNEIIMDTLINPNILIIDSSSIYSLIYQFSINNYFNNNIITPITNKKISIYELVILSNCIYNNIFDFTNNNYAYAININQTLTTNMILVNYQNQIAISDNILNFYQYLQNYNFNNNIFDLTSFNNNLNNTVNYQDINNQVGTILFANMNIFANMESFIYYTTNLIALILESTIPLNNLYKKLSNNIYNINGELKEILTNNIFQMAIFPLSSNLLVYHTNTNTNISSCIYNYPSCIYKSNIKNRINTLYNNNYKLYKSNILYNNYKINDDVYNTFNDNYLTPIINNYYENTVNYTNNLNIIKINNVINNILLNNYSKQIYNTSTNFNIDTCILENIFSYVDDQLYGNSFFNYSYNGENNYFLTKDLNRFTKFFFVPAAPLYRLYFIYSFLIKMSSDTKLLNIMPKDLIILRDLILLILNYILSIKNNLILNNIKYNFIDLTPQCAHYGYKNNPFNLNQNFLCYDKLNILLNGSLDNLLKNNSDNNQIYLYTAFYFIKNNIYFDINQSNNNNIKNIINSIYNIKYNYDDIMFNYLLETINNNSQYFINLPLIIDLLNAFYNKNTNSFNTCVNILSKIINSTDQYTGLEFGPVQNYNSDIFKQNLYDDYYYLIYSIGILFDNVNKINITTINDIYNLTTNTINYNIYAEMYINETFDIKKYKNIISSTQIIEGFVYYKTLLYNNINTFLLTWFDNLKLGIIKYIFDNYIYLTNYTISDYLFNDLLSIYDNYMLLYNLKNNSNINLLSNTILQFNKNISNNRFITNNIIVIYFLYYLYIINCMYTDILNYINLYLYSTIQVELQTFENYLINKYSENIYLNCLEKIINLINNSTDNLTINYAVLNLSNIKDPLEDFSNLINEIPIKNLYYSKINNINNINIDDKVIFNQLNKDDNVNWNQNNIINSTYNIITYDTMFYNKYKNTVLSTLSQLQKMLFLVNNKSLITKTYIANVNAATIDLNILYNATKNNIYNDSLNIIENIWNNLQLIYYANANATIVIDDYSVRIVEQIFDIIKNNYYNKNINYFKTLYFKNFDTTTTTHTTTRTTTTIDSIVQNKKITNVELSTDLLTYSINYLNGRIQSTFNIEKIINKYIYYWINQTIILNDFNNDIINFMNSHTLYDYVRMYNNNYITSINKIYETNLSIYQNDIVNEIYNFKNMDDSNAFLNNSIFLDFIINFTTDINDINSFFYNFTYFYKFIIENNPNIFNKMNLISGENILDYFRNPLNNEDLNNYIYDLINLTEPYSPFHIYDNVIEHFNKNLINPITNINAKLFINLDHLIKKITIYLFMIYLINVNISNLINLNLVTKLKKNMILEYTFSQSNVKNINLNQIYENNDFIIDLCTYIYNITLFDKSYPSIYKRNYINSNTSYIISQLNNDILTITTPEDFLTFCSIYTSSFEKTIGFNNTITTNLLTENHLLDKSISLLVKNYNCIINNDCNLKNPNLYNATAQINNTINYYFKLSIYNLNDSSENYIENNSKFINNATLFYNKTQIININLLFTLLIKILNGYNISYPNLNTEIDNLIGNLRIGNTFLNKNLEILKGYTSNLNISNEMLLFTKEQIYNLNNIFSRSTNIIQLTNLVANNKNLSSIIPIDYDYDIINLNYGNIYNNGINIYKKFYNYDYNNYQYPLNYQQIYIQKNTYYTNIINNEDSLIYIKDSNILLFNNIFTDIIYTKLALIYFNYTDNNIIFFSNFQELIQLYMKYNFEFRINLNLSNIENLKLQSLLFESAKKTLSLNDISNFIEMLYFYELFNKPYHIDLINSNTIEYDYILFSENLNLINNYSFKYLLYVNNFVYTIQNLFELIRIYLNNNFKNINLINSNILNDCLKLLIDDISNKEYINKYIIESYNQFNTNENDFLYIVFINTIEYNDLIIRFSNAVREIVYYQENISIRSKMLEIYQTYFKDIIFNYKKYIYNEYVIVKYSITIEQMEQYIYSYLNYKLNNKNNIIGKNSIKILFNNLINLYFENIDLNIIINVFMWIKNDILYNSNIDVNINKETLITQITDYLYNQLINIYWGIVYDDYINTNSNKQSLFFKILLMNYQFIIKNNQNTSASGLEYIVENIFNINSKLEILYKLKILIAMILNISDSEYNRLLLEIFLNCNTYIYRGLSTSCLKYQNDITVLMDYLNSNIIKKNNISNYFKSIQNLSIKNNIKYNITSFQSNQISKNNFMYRIYQNLNEIFNQNTEFTILLNFYQNSIINILNNYSNNVTLYNISESNVAFIHNFFNLFITIITNNLEIIKKIFGGTSKLNKSINVSLQYLLKIFSEKQYKYNDNFITIFTLIYDNFNNYKLENINYLMIIQLFYYICMIVYILNKNNSITNEYFFNTNTDLIYILINLINTNMINYINNIDNISNIIFFQKLTDLLFKIDNNQLFIENCIQFFDSLIDLQTYYNKDLMDNINYNIGTKMYDGIGVLPGQNNFVNKLYNQYINNDKTRIWNNILTLIVDPNDSYPTFIMKSMMDDPIINIPDIYMKKILESTDGLINNNGILQYINNIELYIGNELIDTINLDMYNIIRNVFSNLNKNDTLDQMLGIPPITNIFTGLKPYIFKLVGETINYIPTQFFFNEIMNSIPLISCMYADLNIKLNLNNNNTLIKDFYNTTIINSNTITNDNKIKTSMYADFILLEREERKILSTNRQDNLIELHNSYTLSKNIEINNQDYLNYQNINFDFNIINVVKEIFWTLDFYINDYLIKDNINNIVLSTIFYINGNKRDGIQPITGKNYNNITRIINGYKYNTKNLLNNQYNIYSFALEPEKFQPTGGINMSLINTFTIQLVLDKKKLLEYYNEFIKISNLNVFTIKMQLNTLEYNIIRYQSGLAGLLFLQ